MSGYEDQVRRNVVDQLAWDDRVDASGIMVEVSPGGDVCLSGTVPNYVSLMAADNDARSVPGVVSVRNQLSVLYPTAAALPSDDEIARRLELLFGWNALVDETTIDASVERGRVKLMGSVDSFWKKDLVQDRALELFGVKEVVNELAVVPTRDVADEAIAEDVMSAMDRINAIDPRSVEVRVENGEVTLTGTVPGWTAFRGAYDAALFTPGVRNVVNNITMR